MKLSNMFEKVPLANRVQKKTNFTLPVVKDISKIPVNWPAPRQQGAKDYKVIATPEDLIAYLKRCELTGICGFDYETAPSVEEHKRWENIKQVYQIRITTLENNPGIDDFGTIRNYPPEKEALKKIKDFEKELEIKKEDYLRSPLDPWRAEVCTVSLSAAPDEARVIYISHKAGSKNFKGTRKQVFDILEKYLFSNKKIIKAAVNLAFETKFTAKYGKYILSPVADPLIMWVRCLQVAAPEKIKDRKRPAAGKGLKPMTKEIFSVEMAEFTKLLEKHKVNFFDEMNTDYVDTLMYSAEDSDFAVQHYLYWTEVAKQIPGYYEWLQNIEMPFTRVIGIMEYHGMPWDETLAAQKHQEAEIAIEEIINEIEQLAKDLFRIQITAGKNAKTNDIKDLIFNKMKLPSAKVSDKTGDSSLDKEALIDMIFMLENNLQSIDEEEYLNIEIPEGQPLNYKQQKALEIRNRKPHPYKEEGIKLLKLLQKIAKYSTLLSSHIEGRERYLHPVTGRIHANYSQWTETGRLNSYNPNQQNTPRPHNDDFKIRNFHRAPKGKVLLLADFSGFELRLMAWRAKDKIMIDIFNNGGDLHKTTAAELTGKPFNEVTKKERQDAKAANFGISYGGTEYALQKTYKIDYGVRKTLEECKAAVEAVKRAYPGIPEYQRNIVLEAREKGYVETIYGYKRMLPDINSSNNYKRGQDERKAANTPIQGSAADIMKRSQNEIYELMGTKEGIWKHVAMIGQIHDEIIFEVTNDVEIVKRVAEEVKKVMEKEPLPDFPVKIVADVEIAEEGWGDKMPLEDWLKLKLQKEVS